jgi:hypothetical protein
MVNHINSLPASQDDPMRLIYEMEQLGTGICVRFAMDSFQADVARSSNFDSGAELQESRGLND